MGSNWVWLWGLWTDLADEVCGVAAGFHVLSHSSHVTRHDIGLTRGGEALDGVVGGESAVQNRERGGGGKGGRERRRRSDGKGSTNNRRTRTGTGTREGNREGRARR